MFSVSASGNFGILEFEWNTEINQSSKFQPMSRRLRPSKRQLAQDKANDAVQMSFDDWVEWCNTSRCAKCGNYLVPLRARVHGQLMIMRECNCRVLFHLPDGFLPFHEIDLA